MHPDAAGDPGSPAFIERLVAGHVPADPRETESRRRFLEALGRLERPCEEDADPVHVTASAVVVGVRGTLLLLHRRLGRWMQPGGHIERGEAPWEAARREAHEESGLTLEHPPGGPCLLQLDVHQAALGHTHLDLRYLLFGPDAPPSPPPHESQDVRWYGWEEAAQLADASLIGALEPARRHWEEVVVG